MKSSTVAISLRTLSFTLLSHAKDILFNFALNFFFTHGPRHGHSAAHAYLEVLQHDYPNGIVNEQQDLELPQAHWHWGAKDDLCQVAALHGLLLGFRLLCLGFGLLCLGFGWLCRLFRLCRCCHVFSNFLFCRRTIIFWSFVIINNQPVFIGCCWLLSWDNAASYTALVKEASISSTMLYSCFIIHSDRGK